MAAKKHIEDLIASLEDRDEAAASEQLRALYEDEPAGFGEGFAGRVMQRLGAGGDDGLTYFLPRMFKWVAIAGVAAAAVLLVTILSGDASLSMDTLSGVSDITISDNTVLNNF